MNNKSNTSLLISLLGLVILAGAYFLGYTEYTNKRILMESETAILQEKYNHLLAEQSKKEFYQTEAVNLNLKRKELISEFAYEITSEKIISYVLELENSIGFHCSSINIQTNSVSDNTEQTSQSEPDENQTDTLQSDKPNLLLYTLDLSITCTYDKYKELINYIDNYKERTTISNIAVAYDAQTKLLNGSLTINLYALTGVDRDINKETYLIDDNIKGVANIFSTGVSKLPDDEKDNTTETTTEETTQAQ